MHVPARLGRRLVAGRDFSATLIDRRTVRGLWRTRPRSIGTSGVRQRAGTGEAAAAAARHLLLALALGVKPEALIRQTRVRLPG